MSQVLISIPQFLATGDEIIGQIRAQIDALGVGDEKKALQRELEKLSASFRFNAEHYVFFMPSAFFRELRQKIVDFQIDENLVYCMMEEFKKINTALNKYITPCDVAEWEKLQKEFIFINMNSLSLERKLNALTSLISRTRSFAQTAASMSGISLAGLVEEKYSISARQKLCKQNDDSEMISSLLSDIIDFGTRIKFLNTLELQNLQPLMEEAKTCTGEFRMSAICDQIKMTYGKLKEQKVLTEIFKQEMQDMLPLLKRTEEARSLIFRMEELLNAENVSREEFMPLYESAKVLISGQLERIIDETVLRKVSDVLSDMGYSLAGDKKTEKKLLAGDVNFIDSPYDGYQVKLKVDKGGTLSTRLVRIVGSEEEKAGGEYQRQKDIEIGHKWCKDLEKLHETMKLGGIVFETKLRKEPEELPLDIIVDASKKDRKQGQGEVSKQEKQMKKRIA